jgi:hypothetical protein
MVEDSRRVLDQQAVQPVLQPLADGRGQGRGRLATWRSVPAGAEVQVHPATLELELVDVALAVVPAPGLEGQQLGVPRERLEDCQHVSNCHALSVATRAR